ncbi:hypothetical protein [Streptomyces griseus]|uniref:hypothetical protein n=1 Tax=Streptomyces griseus TaxID=1911 RepID=UPI00084066DD|nr:hypothetical protein [Streptomyces griseus]
MSADNRHGLAMPAPAEAVDDLAELSGPDASMLPQVESLRISSAGVAAAVARRAERDGVLRAALAARRSRTPWGSRNTPDR